MSTIFVKSPKDLEKNVLAKDLCSACGACTNVCPYIDMVQGKKAVIVEDCGLSEGRCYAFCPRTALDVPSLNEFIFGSLRSDLVLGMYTSVVKARAKNSEIQALGQYGGVVTALFTFAFENGIIDTAVLVGSKDEIRGETKIVRNKNEVSRCARSKYVVCPTLEGVIEALRQENANIGIVGTPCQVTAVRKMQFSKLLNESEKIKLVIGIFCTWALVPEVQEFLLNKARSAKILKLDVPPPPANILVLQTSKGKIEVSLDNIRKFIMPACNICFNMTNEFADISVGTVEGDEGWNIVIVRTTNGEKLFRHAVEKGIIEIKPLEKEKLHSLYEASLDRKKKALKKMASMGINYLIIRSEDRSKLLSL